MRVTGVILVAAHLLAAAVCDASPTDWDAWYEGDVRVDLRVQGGEGADFVLGSEVSFEFEATESAYHMVVGVDAQGGVQLLFPRFWEDDGWVRRGSIQQVHPCDFASGRQPWQSAGVVYVEVISSPRPFDWHRLGLRRDGQSCRWWGSTRPWVLQGDPHEVFNALHRRLFPRWDAALFTVDSTWFSVSAACAPGRVVRRHGIPVVVSNTYVRPTAALQLRWEWQFGPWCARPVYRYAYSARRHHPSVQRPRPSHVESQQRVSQSRQRLRTDTDPRLVRKRAAPVRVRNPKPAVEPRVVVRQENVQKRSEEKRRKLR